jgi:enoyl-CoA hydratase
MLTLENVRVEVVGAIATVTIDRPRAMNALNAATLYDLAAAFDAIDADATIRGVILTGSGEKAFVAGADIAAMTTMTADEASTFSRLGSGLFARIEKFDRPVIAAVNGFALGGGCELALACDFIFAAENARFGQPEVNLGLIAGFGGTQRLPRAIPYGLAMELLTTGRMIDAAEALRVGLVNRVLPTADLMSVTRSTMEMILSRGPVAVRITRELVRQTRQTSQNAGLEAESAAFGAIFETSDAREGTRAFVAKQTPAFTGK